jgi:glycosyltransferase involved in cell wall biosynthesis
MNWYESIYSDKKLKPFIRKFFLLLLLKLSSKKIIWTVHNKTTHEGSIYSKFLFFFMKKMSFKIHILCPATIQECNLQEYKKKIIYVPHGDYFNCYPQSGFDIFKYYSIASHYKILLFMGRIMPYKNIELLIESFEKSDMPENNWKLLICGNLKINYNYYKTDIQKCILNKENVIIDFNFIPDDKISSYLTQSNLLIAPYNKKSSLNSGALWLAFSYSKTMIMPNIGCVRDLPNRDDFLYVYDYETAEEHLDNLVKTLNKVNKDSDFLEEKGKMAHKVMEENSWENNKEKWLKLIQCKDQLNGVE